MAMFFSVYKYILGLINTRFGGLLYCGGWFVRMVCVFFVKPNGSCQACLGIGMASKCVFLSMRKECLNARWANRYCVSARCLSCGEGRLKLLDGTPDIK